MQGKNKYVSSLDLKYLDAKFTVIHDNDGISSNLNYIRKSKISQFPSILKSKPQDDTTLNSSMMSPYSRLETLEETSNHQMARCTSVESNKQHLEHQKSEIMKYKYYIQNIKRANQLMHKEITSLYKQQKICDNQPKSKPIRSIFEAGKGLITKPSRVKLSPTKTYQNIYENLCNNENPYRNESINIQKKFASNNLHKSFQSFLLSHNKRVPQFIKNIR